MTVRAGRRPAGGRDAPKSAAASNRVSPWRLWWPDVALVALFAVIVASLGLAPVREFDLAVRDLVDAHRPYAAELVARTLNRLGTGGVLASVSLALAALVGVRRRSWWPFAPVIAAFVLTAAVIQPLKVLLDRPAPHAPLPDDTAVRLFADPDAVSFPSGHAVNAVVWYAVIVLLLAPPARVRKWLRFAPPVIVTAAATYLGYHWLTDMLAGLALAVPLSHALTRVPWPGLTSVDLGPGVVSGSANHDASS